MSESAQRRLSVLVALALAGAVCVAAQELSRGTPVRKVPCHDDPSWSYALYLPAGYDPERPAPILYALDARGRAMHALERFREAAERFGWIVASSWDSRSDGPMQPNIEAMSAMWRDTHELLSIDDRRVYLTGFSGGARAATMLATAAPGTVAGVIAAGAGFSPDEPPHPGLPFAVYGVAGDTDFNWDELQQLDATLDELGTVHRIESFEGPHAWPPAEDCAAAVAWMELVAMAQGRRARDPELIDAMHEQDRAVARELEAAGRLYDAWHRYDAVASDFAELRAVDEARAAAERLAGSKALREERRQRERRARGEAEALERAQRALAMVPPGEERRSLGKVLSRLDLPSLEARARGDDREERLSAGRVLASIFAQTSFYVPRDLIERDEYERALLVLSVAKEIEPESPRVWMGLARVHALLREPDQALGWLERLVRANAVDASMLEEDPHLAPLRAREDFGKLVERVRAGAQ